MKVNSCSSKNTAQVVLAFGIIFTLFLGNDYLAIVNTYSLVLITAIKVVFLILSTAIFLYSKHITEHRRLIYLINAYDIYMGLGFLFILKQYESLSYSSVFSLMTVILVIYLLPNRIIFSQIISVMLSAAFFLSSAQRIEGLKQYDIYMIIAYQVVLLIYCNLNVYLTCSSKRKQFIVNRELLTLSTTDPLTGIYNRAKLDEELDKWINYSNRYAYPLSLIIFDIDDFKKVNDSKGHLAGDEVLKNIVATIKDCIRNTDVFARWGGEEFTILLPNTDIEQAGKMAERMRRCISEKQMHESVKNISCSFGIATFEKDDSPQSLFQKADALLLQAKAGGKNRIVTSSSTQ